MFKGSGSDEINEIANIILRYRRKVLSESKEFKELQIIAYVGYDQYRALMRIEPRDAHSVRDKIFLGAKIIKVTEDSYLHVTVR